MTIFSEKKNCQIWNDTKPYDIQKNPMHPQNVTDCWGFRASGQIIIVNGEYYRLMITYIFWP